jgi:uncharacterized membrane protein
MFPEYFAPIETVIAAILAVLLAHKYIQSRKKYHLVWMAALIFWSALELGIFLHFVHGSTPITEKIVSILVIPITALYAVGMLFLLQGLFRRPWAKYFLVYTLVVYGASVGAIFATTVRQELVMSSSFALLIAPGFIVAVSSSIHSYFLGGKRNLLIAIGLLVSVITDLLWDIGGLPVWTLDTVSETLAGVGFLIAVEPPSQKANE